MARPPKPAQLHLIQGTARPDRHDASVASVPALPGDMQAPEWLSPGAVAVFYDVVTRLEPLRLLSAADRDAVAHYAAIMDQIQSAPHMATAAMHSQARNLRSDLGMTPVARTRTKSGEAPKQNPFEALK